MDIVTIASKAVHEALSKLDVMHYLDMPHETAEVAARAALAAMLEAVGEPVEGGLRCASSWLEHHAQHVGRCVGDSACTCGLVRIRLDVSLGLYSLAALREEV